MHEPPPPKDDGLVIPEVGPWSRDKHYFLFRYLDAFTNAMKTKPWDSLHYLDLFAGAGIERIRGTGELKWGSPLLAAQTPCPFHRLHFCEQDPDKCEALRTRAANLNLQQEPQIVCGDSNEQVELIVKAIPPRSLSLAFLDPYGLHLHFETLKVLEARRIDLIIFFPDYSDLLRNWKLYRDQRVSNMDRYFGPCRNWEEFFEESAPDRWADELRERYVAQIRKLGYKNFEYERIFARGRPLWKLPRFCAGFLCS